MEVRSKIKSWKSNKVRIGKSVRLKKVRPKCKTEKYFLYILAITVVTGVLLNFSHKCVFFFFCSFIESNPMLKYDPVKCLNSERSTDRIISNIFSIHMEGSYKLNSYWHSIQYFDVNGIYTHLHKWCQMEKTKEEM